jgi:hypothetical protein
MRWFYRLILALTFLLVSCGGGGGSSQGAAGGAPVMVTAPTTVEFSVVWGVLSAPKTVTVALPEPAGMSYLVVQAGPDVQATATLTLSGAEVTIRAAGSVVGVLQTQVDVQLCADPACSAVRATVRIPVRIDTAAAVRIPGAVNWYDMRAGFGIGGPDHLLPLEVPNVPGQLTVALTEVDGQTPPTWLAVEVIERRELRLRLPGAERLAKGVYSTPLRLKFQPEGNGFASEYRVAIVLTVDDAGCRSTVLAPDAATAITNQTGAYITGDELLRFPLTCYGAPESVATVSSTVPWMQARVAKANVGQGYELVFDVAREPLAALPNLSRHRLTATVQTPGLPSLMLSFDILLNFGEITSVSPSAIAANTPTEITLRGNALNSLLGSTDWLVADGVNIRAKRSACTTVFTDQCDVIFELAGMPAGVYPMRVRNALGITRPGVVLTVDP